MAQVVFRTDQQQSNPVTELIACFPTVKGLAEKSFFVEPWKSPATTPAGLTLWAWKQVGAEVLMTADLLEEDDPDDAPVRTRHGLIAHDTDNGLWAVDLAAEGETDDRILKAIMEVVRNRS